MTTELSKFNELKANISVFVAPTLDLVVVDFKSEQEAIDAGKTLKTYMNELEKKRKELVKPLNDQVDLINDYAKTIKEPMLKAEMHIKSQIGQFEIQQEKIRQEERRKLEVERLEAIKKEQEERERISKELEEKRRLELEHLEAQHKESSELFGSEDPEQLEKERERIQQETEMERLQIEAKLDADRAIADAKRKEQNYDINQKGAKGVKKIWKCEVTDIDQVPKEFVTRTLNSPMVLAAARGGTTSIPGVKIWQETSIAIGANTYVPNKALEENA